MKSYKAIFCYLLVILVFFGCKDKQVESSPEADNYQKLSIDILKTLNYRKVLASSGKVIDEEPIEDLYEVTKLTDDPQVESLILPKGDIHKKGRVIEAKISECANNPSYGDDTMSDMYVSLDDVEGLKGDQLLVHIKTYGTYSDDCVTDQKKLKKLFIYHMDKDNRKYDFELVVNLGEQ